MYHTGYMTSPDPDPHWFGPQEPKLLDAISQGPTCPTPKANELPSIKDVLSYQSNAVPYPSPLLSSPMPTEVIRSPLLNCLPRPLEHGRTREPPLEQWHVTSTPSLSVQSRRSSLTEPGPEDPVNLPWDQLSQSRKARRRQYIQSIWTALDGKMVTSILPFSMWPTTLNSDIHTRLYPYESPQPDKNVQNWNDSLLWLLARLFGDNVGKDLKVIVDTLQGEMVTRLCSQAKEEDSYGLQPKDVERVIRRFQQPHVQPRSNTDEAMVRRFQPGCVFV
ncbi:hypothetical protein BU16DRAFT_272201 [Lophium mytilinum]|uniref:Uncharacterized protein n=1 Tax=Lophium mytilinum TaxID=390894 RepID=A0A6A6R7J0_9PEZI|nr:hypothetical protein BU16DRAFT_272201 [Lophium mytilinum]